MIEGDSFRINAPHERRATVKACGRYCADKAIDDTAINGLDTEGTSFPVGNCQVELDCAGPNGSRLSVLRKPSQCGAKVVARYYDEAPSPSLVSVVARDPFATTVEVLKYTPPRQAANHRV